MPTMDRKEAKRRILGLLTEMGQAKNLLQQMLYSEGVKETTLRVSVKELVAENALIVEGNLWKKPSSTTDHGMSETVVLAPVPLLQEAMASCRLDGETTVLDEGKTHYLGDTCTPAHEESPSFNEFQEEVQKARNDATLTATPGRDAAQPKEKKETKVTDVAVAEKPQKKSTATLKKNVKLIKKTNGNEAAEKDAGPKAKRKYVKKPKEAIVSTAVVTLPTSPISGDLAYAKTIYIHALDAEIIRLTNQRNALLGVSVAGLVKDEKATPTESTPRPVKKSEGFSGSFTRILTDFLDNHAGTDFTFTQLMETVGKNNNADESKLRAVLGYLKKNGRIASGGHGLYKSINT
jgi:hypothetical protein